MKKLYLGWIRDHSGSMSSKRGAAMADYNSQVESSKQAALTSGLDTIVTVIGCGVALDPDYTRRAVYGNRFENTLNSVTSLQPLDSYSAVGNTPLYDAIAMMIRHFESLPDIKDAQVLIEVFSDGEEYGSQKETHDSIRRLILEKDKLENWTFAARTNAKYQFTSIGFATDNIFVWDGSTSADLERTTVAASGSRTAYMASVATGAMRKTTSFYTDMSKVSAQDVQNSMTDISSQVKIFTTTGDEVIKPFVEKMTGSYLKGTAFYQLTKTEDVVQDYKIIVIVNKTTGAAYSGRDARSLLNLPTSGNCKIIPGNHGNFEVYIQSTSINRKLKGGTKLLIWDPMSAVKTTPAPFVNQVPVKGLVMPAWTPPVSTQPVTAKKARKWVMPNTQSEARALGYKDGFGRQKNKQFDISPMLRVSYLDGFTAGKSANPRKS